jgi:tetratricopeptide (TPR) repeat protein
MTAMPPVRADHLNASTHVDKGWTLLSSGDYAGAERELTKACEIAPDDPNTESLLGWALMLGSKYDDALMWFQKVLMAEPHNQLARVNVGFVCLRKGIYGEAIEHLSRAIRENTDRKATLYAHFYLGLVYLEREMYQDARAFFRATIELGPRFIEAYYELGHAYALSGNVEKARRAWSDGYAANKFNAWGKKCAEALAQLPAESALPPGT